MTRRRQTGRMALAALLISGAFLACQTSLTEVTEEVGPRAFNFDVGPAGAGLPSGSVALGGGSVTVTASGLRALATGQYEFWVIGRNSQNLDVPVQLMTAQITENYMRVDTLADGSANVDPITGDTIYVGDSRIITDTVNTTYITGYAGSDDPFVTSVNVVLDSTADGSDPTTYHAVVVTLEPTAGATSPGAARFLWRRIGVGGGGSMLFGNYGGSDVINLTSPNDYVFGTRGAGLGGARGSEVSVDLDELARPPVGFYYAGFITDADGNGVLVDTLRSSWSLDSTVSRVSLFMADVAVLPNVMGEDIRHSQVRNCAAGSAVTGCQNTMNLPVDSTFAGYEEFQLKLLPKGGVAQAREKSVTHTGSLPKAVK
jgi:hypothetical protein